MQSSAQKLRRQDVGRLPVGVVPEGQARIVGAHPVAAVATDEDDVVDAGLVQSLQQPIEDAAAADGGVGLGLVVGEGLEPAAAAGAQDDGAHFRSIAAGGRTAQSGGGGFILRRPDIHLRSPGDRPPMEPRVSFVTLGVADLARATRVYTEVLELEPLSASTDGVTFFELGPT